MSTLLVQPGPVTTITLNRPDVRNAFNETLIQELTEWAHTVPADGSIRTVVLQGAGSVFCAGADVQWMARMIDYSREENLADARAAGTMYSLLDSLPVPVIGRVHGAALGGGAGLAAICDIVVATNDAQFGFTETTLGILPAMISPYVVRKIGVSAAREWCLTGARFTAEQARAMGLVHEVVTPERLVSDLKVLFMCGLPGGYPDDLIDVDLERLEGEDADGVIRVSNADYLARPLQLSPTEATAVIVALRALRDGAGEKVLMRLLHSGTHGRAPRRR